MPRITQPDSWAVNNITNIRTCLDSAESVSVLLGEFQIPTCCNWLKSNESVSAVGRIRHAIDFIQTVRDRKLFVRWKSVRSASTDLKDLLLNTCLNSDLPSRLTWELVGRDSRLGFQLDLVNSSSGLESWTSVTNKEHLRLYLNSTAVRLDSLKTWLPKDLAQDWKPKIFKCLVLPSWTSDWAGPKRTDQIWN